MEYYGVTNFVLRQVVRAALAEEEVGEKEGYEDLYLWHDTSPHAFPDCVTVHCLHSYT